MEDGSVIKYKEKYGEDSGYIYSNYLVKTEEESLKPMMKIYKIKFEIS